MFTTGTKIDERAMNPPRKKTTIDGLRYFLIIFPIMLKKIYMPKPDQEPIHKAYITSSWPKIQKVRVFEKALNNIIYIPVEAVT